MNKIYDLMEFFQSREKNCLEFISMLFSFQKTRMAPRYFSNIWYPLPHLDIRMARVSKSFADNYLVSVILVTKNNAYMFII